MFFYEIFISVFIADQTNRTLLRKKIYKHKIKEIADRDRQETSKLLATGLALVKYIFSPCSKEHSGSLNQTLPSQSGLLDVHRWNMARHLSGWYSGAVCPPPCMRSN